MLERNKPFEPQRLEEERKKDSGEVITIRLNAEEREMLNDCKKVIQQAKDGSAIKSMMRIGAFVIHSKKIRFIIDTLFLNKKRNWRTGISEFED